MYCTAPKFPYTQIRLKLQRKKSGTDVWVTKSFSNVSPPTPIEYFLAKTSGRCNVGKYRSSAKYLYRWDAADPWTVFHGYWHGPVRHIKDVKRCGPTEARQAA